MAGTLFLDADGVLNTYHTRDTRMEIFDPVLVRNLARICEITGCDIVVSSAWRLGGIGPNSSFGKELRVACTLDGVPDRFDFLMSRVVGKTLDLPGSREDEILAYVEDHNIDKFCAVDDDSFPNNPDWLVMTDDETGLDDAATVKIISLLS